MSLTNNAFVASVSGNPNRTARRARLTSLIEGIDSGALFSLIPHRAHASQNVSPLAF